MKIKNPSYIGKSDYQAFIDAHAAKIDNFLAGLNPEKETYTFDELRAEVDKMNLANFKGSDFSDGFWAQVCIDRGIEVF